MTKLSRRLFNVPNPEFYESVCSWISRLALSQGSDVNEVMQYLCFPLDADLDRFVYGDRLTELRDICGLNASAFLVHNRVITSLNSMSPLGDNYLIRTRANKPVYRYCPLCIKEMRIPHFPIHWHFVAWRWCPKHDCLLEDFCQSCGCTAVLPADIASSEAGKLGYGLLNRCQSCAEPYGNMKPCHLQLGNIRRVSRLEEQILANGRGLLAALYYGWFEIRGIAGRQELGRFVDIERYGVLAVRPEWLSPEHVRMRVVNDSGLMPARWELAEFNARSE